MQALESQLASGNLTLWENALSSLNNERIRKKLNEHSEFLSEISRQHIYP